MNLYTNHECPSCKGQGYHQDGGNVWECEDCNAKGIVSSAYIVWLSELAAKTRAEAEASNPKRER